MRRLRNAIARRYRATGAPIDDARRFICFVAARRDAGLFAALTAECAFAAARRAARRRHRLFHWCQVAARAR